MKRIFFIIILLPFLNGCYLNEEVPPDQTTWEYQLPGNLGMDENVLLQLDSDIKEDLFGNTLGVTIIKNDKLVYENYYQNKDRTDLFPIGRLGSGIVTALFGEVLNNKLANQLDTPVFWFFPEYASIFEETPTKKEITIRHLLQMTDGLVWNEALTGIDQEGNNLAQLLNSSDMVEFIFSQQLEAPPGRRFSYNSGCNVILLNLMDKLLDEPLQDYFNQRIFSPLGIKNFQITNTPTGLPNYTLGLSLSQLDLTKIGYLFLKNGEWDGFQIIDSRWMDQILTSQSIISNQNDFGYSWWLFNNESFVFTNYGLDDVNYLFGATNQRIYFSKNSDLLVVINNGLDPGRSFSNSSFWAFLRVLDSLLPAQF